MTANITNSIQFSTFEIVRDIILANSTLNKKFNRNNVFQFEPNLKSPARELPYISITIPNSDTNLLVMSHANTLKSMEISVRMVLDYMARDNLLNYTNALIYQIESSESTFDASGYYNLMVKHNGSNIEIIDQKQVVTATFTINMEGTVWR